MRKFVGLSLCAALVACSSGDGDDGGMNPVPVASVTITPDPAEVLTPAPGNLTLTATTKDASGNVLTGRTITWATTGGATVTPATGATVTLTATAPGTVTAASEGRSSTAVQVTLRTVVAPTVDAVTPATLVPGGTGTITGTNFSATPASNAVTVGGVAVTVTAATPTQLSITLPAASAFPCEPSREAEVRVTVDGVSGTRQHPVQVATQRTLAAGQRLLLTTAADARCNELSQTGGRYLAVVFNGDIFNPGSTPTSQTIQAPAAVSFEFRGAQGIATADPIPATPTLAGNVGAYFDPFAPPSPLAIRTVLGERAVARRNEQAHLRLLEANTRILREMASLRARGQSGVSPNAAAAPNLPSGIRTAVNGTIGANNQVRIPNINATNFCNQYTEVTAKTVYNGTRTIILADNANPNVGDMTSFYDQVGQEFDNVMFSILQTNFGNPLAMDAATDNNAKVVMVFSNAVNNLGGVAGFVVSCDFYSRTTIISGTPNSSSNFGEFFYAIVPTSSQPGFPSTGNFVNDFTKEAWIRSMRSTIVHEVKHITSFGERIARSAGSFEMPAFEEGIARHAEEIWARQAVYSGAWKGDLTYQTTLFCDVRPTTTSCAGKPFAVFRHFQTLYDYMSAPETFTPLGRVQASDFNFYASMWSFVRWAVDNYASSEAALLGGMTQSDLVGMANLTAQTGRSSDDMLADWLLSLFLDNYPGFTPAAGLKLSIPTWNMRDIFAGMNNDFCTNQQLFCRAYPLQPRQVAFGAAYSSGSISVRGGSGAFFEISGTQTGKQLLDIHAPGGGAPSANIRLALLRVN